MKDSGLLFKRITGFILTLVFTVTSSFSEADEKSIVKKYKGELNIVGLEDAIKSAKEYMIKNCLDKGQFVYKNHLETDSRNRKYNILRHAGAIYALSVCYKVLPDSETKNVLKRAGEYLCGHIKEIDSSKNAIFSHWSESSEFGENQAKLGGSGLGLIAFTNLNDIVPGVVPENTLQKLAEFILYMQEPDGRFFSKYIRNYGKSGNFVSLYYPGEAMLGLMFLFERDNNRKWLDSAIKGMLFLAKERKGDKNPPEDHWAMLASRKILKYWDKTQNFTLDDKKLIIDHIRQIAVSLYKYQALKTGNQLLDGSFVPDGRVCPSATRLEGLLAILEIPEVENKLKDEIGLRCEVGIKFLLNSQLKKGQLKGGFPRAVIMYKGNTPAELKFNARAGEIRIDYVQHSLSALVQYYNMLQGKKSF